MGKVMKVFKTLINELFGTKREYKVEGLGIFTCKVCDWWREMLPLEWCSAIALLLGRNSCFDRRGRFCSVLQAIIGITGAIAELGTYGRTTR